MQPIDPDEQVILDQIKARIKDRTCLRCGVTFRSRGPQNRLCAGCFNSNLGIADLVPHGREVLRSKVKGLE